jgi:uncharacterized protein YhbP (UPF0306 family)
MAKRRYLVGVKFHGTKTVYTYQSTYLFAAGAQVVVTGTNGETKVVTVVKVESATKTEIASKPYFVKPIRGLVITIDDLEMLGEISDV